MIYEGKPEASNNSRVGIVVAKFNRTITQRLLDGALARLRKAGVTDEQMDIYWVPGAFELPLALEKLLLNHKHDGYIALGAVIRGETTHDQHINRTISDQFACLSVKHLTPIMFGVLTCNTVEQAIARSGSDLGAKDKTDAPHRGNKGADCAEALLEVLSLFDLMDEGSAF